MIIKEDIFQPDNEIDWLDWRSVHVLVNDVVLIQREKQLPSQLHTTKRNTYSHMIHDMNSEREGKVD